MSKIIITSDRNKFADKQVLVRPIHSKDIWSYMFNNDSIMSLRDKRYLLKNEDDRGLAARLRLIFPSDIKTTFMAQGIDGITFMCPSYEGKFKHFPLVNTIMVCDGISGNKFIDHNILRAKMFTYMEQSMDYQLCEYVVLLGENLSKLYQKDSILDTVAGHCGMLVRDMDLNLKYFLEDPFANIHEPQYLMDLEMTESIPSLNRVEDLIEFVMSNVDWDTVKMYLPSSSSGKYQWLTSVMMDQFYFNILYYSISRSLWLDNKQSDQTLQGVEEEPVLVDFALIKRKLRNAIIKKLGKESEDSLKISKETVTIEEDISWVFGREE